MIAAWFPIVFLSSLKGGLFHHRLNLLETVWAVAGGVITLWYLPGTILSSDQGLEQVYWLHQNERILWPDIAEIITEKNHGLISIEGADGTRIVHTFLHSDRNRMLMELKQRCGDNLPVDFPREMIDAIEKSD
jgi:hypothetical protein